MTPTQNEFIVVGDQMQSAASRMVGWVASLNRVTLHAVPYEVRMAALEAESAVADWTELRRQSAGPLLNYRKAARS